MSTCLDSMKRIRKRNLYKEGKGDTESHTGGQNDSQTGKWANGKTDDERDPTNSLTDQQKDRWTERQTDR